MIFKLLTTPVMTWTDWLQQLDETLFISIHHFGNVELLDPVMLLLRNALTWVPLYAFVLYFVIRHRPNKAVAFLVGTLICFAIADYGSASIFKPFFQRERPCHNDDLVLYLHQLIGCGGRYGFPSSHASNHFALAAFWFFAMRQMGIRRLYWNWVWIWALLVCYAQVYVGKHYPLDILGGAAFGVLTGFLVSRLFAWWDRSGIRLRKRNQLDTVS
ncbi:phosphatase PAP2 family protein [Chitinophaga horti]|uniref:Phosphatase PAP2 family protein n=1 Tax=Chitinophaga horti TaxID=2920382 RepID=A0ABY6J490_9BACT|nr:phosphatase PAP2 family protein [Chitinophaga horti]UYQ94489.1 phosphatase PAP2 family protein [Chitinophaga horti]